MFGILFGWRKASKCKKLIRHVQCRLKLLKNKRCSIVRQLRDDVAQLLRYGHEQSAFDRVEQLFKDESIVAVYDLLDHFCEFIIIHLSYIRKHKDCPNDINEAVSTLIYASSRCGDLPELPVIRKLFGERYGQRFAMVALDLLPGNLVNHQVKENLSIKLVPDDVKYRLVDEIGRSCLQPGPLAIEYYSELQLEQKNKIIGDQVLRGDVQNKCKGGKDAQVQGFDVMEAEGKIVHMDVSSDSKKLSIEPCHSHQVVKFTNMNSPDEFRIAGLGTESSSPECLSPLPKEMIYLDDIEELKSPLSKGQSFQDQRLFLFKSLVILATENLENGFDEKNESRNEKIGSKSSRKSRNASGKRQRRSGFQEGTSVKDVESTIYYENSRKSHHRRKHLKKICFDETHECSLEYPCYFCVSDDKDEQGSQKRKTTTPEGFTVHNLNEEEIKKSEKQNSPYSHRSYLRAMTMPPERPSDDCGADHNMLRSNSYPFQQPSHVHPKLPDYDLLAAKFTALKKANLQYKIRD